MTKVMKLKFYVISLFLISTGLTQVNDQQFSQEQRDELRQNLSNAFNNFSICSADFSNSELRGCNIRTI